MRPAMSSFRVLPFLFVLALPLAATVAPGTRIDTLPAGKHTYTDVTVRSVNAVTVVILHSGGLASVPLRDLSPEWQQRFNYNPQAEADALAAKPVRPPALPAPPAAPASPVRHSPSTPVENLLASLGSPPVPRPLVDLRPRFFDFKLHAKDQGRRPSCSVFAVVSALEFQNAVLVGQAQKFSEEYLIWATRKLLGQTAPAADTSANEDEGFSLAEVVTALRTYGVLLQDDMPNTIGQAMGAIAEPPPALIGKARGLRLVSINQLPGRTPRQTVEGIIHAINAEVPVIVGLRWPHERAIRNGFLSRQRPIDGYAHAVTIVGYRSETGRIEDTIFIFKNSWGPQWAQGGFGNVTHGYLLDNLQVAVVLDVQTPGPR